MIKRICFIAIVAFAGMLIASSLLAAEEQLATVTITGLEGTVLVKIQPSTEWIAAKVGQVLQKGDGIKTLSDGKAHLKLSGNIGFLMQPNSEFIIETPLIAEPYSEAGGESADPVFAPNANAEGQASKI